MEEYRDWTIVPDEDDKGLEATKGSHPLLTAKSDVQMKAVIDWYEDATGVA